MADISSITLPSGDTFYFKDSVARSTSKVSGIKGSAENAYRTGDVNLTAANVGAADLSNLVTSISSGSTDFQYPSAKCMYNAIDDIYDIIGNVESLLAAI